MKRMFVILLCFGSSLSAQSFDAFVEKLSAAPPSERAERVEQFFRRHPAMPLIEDSGRVNFVYYGTADTVLLNGNLQHWVRPDTMKRIDCDSNAFFYASYRIPLNARLDYQFVVDGRYITDPRDPDITPSGFGQHSELRMPAFRSTPYIVHHDSVPHGTLTPLPFRMQIPPPLSHYTMTGRTVTVYLPPGYDSLSGLPSVYVHDGNEAIDYARLPDIIDNMIAANAIAPVIAVFIPPVERSREYRLDWQASFSRMICDELVPLIDRTFRTSRSPQHRAMMGISDGGHIALMTVLSHLDVFHNVAGQSPTITPQLRDLTASRALKGTLTPAVRIYIDCGVYDIMDVDSNGNGYDFLQLNRSYSTLLSSLHVPHYYREVNDGHEWGSWRQRMPDILSFFFRK